ncbi:hypothetical protein OESDEN_19265 [Oesophagostomum dentatum]|uniref:Uncharacterized protein n=1 Tax=Oesophagostomum dentatum TaxID=61180 RepID=A0A0B1SBZ7_OESDE|nr:hypothetical protein OESDEN_19265 [Oesophagostomum dentatum]
MVTVSRTRTSSSSTTDLDGCRWPTLDLTPTDLSSSSALSRPPGSMAATLSSARFSKAWMLFVRSRTPRPTPETAQLKRSRSLTAVRCH